MIVRSLWLIKEFRAELLAIGRNIVELDNEVEARDATERSLGLKSSDRQNVESSLLGGKIRLEYLLVDALTEGDSDRILERYELFSLMDKELLEFMVNKLTRMNWIRTTSTRRRNEETGCLR